MSKIETSIDMAHETDIVALVLSRVMSLVPGLSEELATSIENQVKAEYGGRRMFVHKRSKHPTLAQREAMFQDGLTGMSTTELIEKHKISRATLYRNMKMGGRFDGGS